MANCGGARSSNRFAKATRLIVALSENSEQSKPCQAELDYAIALDRPIIPVQIGSVESVMVNRVGERQIIDYRNPTPIAPSR